MGCRFLLQGIFPTQGSNQSLLRTLQKRRVLYHWATCEALIVKWELSHLLSSACLLTACLWRSHKSPTCSCQPGRPSPAGPSIPHLVGTLWDGRLLSPCHTAKLTASVGRPWVWEGVWGGTHVSTRNLSSAIPSGRPWTAHRHLWLPFEERQRTVRQGQSYVPMRCKWDVKRPVDNERVKVRDWGDYHDFSLLYLFLVISTGMRIRLLVSLSISFLSLELPQTQW